LAVERSDDVESAPYLVISAHAQGAPLRSAILRTRQWLLSEQDAEGYWVGELEGDTILESEYILLQAYLGRADAEICRKAARHLLRQQTPDGGWAIYPGGELEISASVKAYFALKLTGHDPSCEYMQRARKSILAHGGADAVNSFTRFYLALLGQISYAECPAVPPQFCLLPRWFPINLYSISAWSRTIVVPLSIMWAFQPATQIESRLGIRELFLKPPQEWPELHCPGMARSRNPFSWDRNFRRLDRVLKFLQQRSWLPFRKRGIAAAKRWMIERFEGSDGLGAIFPPMVWSIIALKCLGYADDSPEMAYCHERLNGLILEDGDSARLQPCKSPVWDTAITLRALADAGVPNDHPAVQQGVRWLLKQEVRRRGDWSKNVDAEPAGWCFEYANEFYPDVDDTIMAMMALQTQFDKPALGAADFLPSLELLAEVQAEDRPDALRKVVTLDKLAAALARAENWILAMQNRDGGWGAFDRNNTAEFLCHVPFADHNAMIDPSSPDLAGRVLEALAQRGRKRGDAAIDRAIAYLRETQEADGSWFGRWGVNYIYGTWQVICGLIAAGVSTEDPAILAGANWLIAHQQADGGWGESCDTYADPRLRGQGPVTASQTAWAVLALIAAGQGRHRAVADGIQFLIQSQQNDGTWHETQFTGTGFPRVFYLKYHLYPIYFPLLALGRFAATLKDTSGPRDRRLLGLAEEALSLVQ
jgi:squalene-hopene/tetraprenyl-beta-curcumene cyclase